MAGGEAVWENEFTLKGRDKARVQVRVRGILVRDASGRPVIFAENNPHGPGATVSFELPVDASTVPFPPSTLLVRQAAD